MVHRLGHLAPCGRRNAATLLAAAAGHGGDEQRLLFAHAAVGWRNVDSSTTLEDMLRSTHSHVFCA